MCAMHVGLLTLFQCQVTWICLRNSMVVRQVLSMASAYPSNMIAFYLVTGYSQGFLVQQYKCVGLLDRQYPNVISLGMWESTHTFITPSLWAVLQISGSISLKNYPLALAMHVMIRYSTSACISIPRLI